MTKITAPKARVAFPKLYEPVGGINPECYEGKAACAAYLERQGVAVEREGNRLFGLRPMRFEGSTTYQRVEVRTMVEARALNKLIG